jgi:uncharacterized protein (TIGR00296 family)
MPLQLGLRSQKFNTDSLVSLRIRSIAKTVSRIGEGVEFAALSGVICDIQTHLAGNETIVLAMEQQDRCPGVFHGTKCVGFFQPEAAQNKSTELDKGIYQFDRELQICCDFTNNAGRGCIGTIAPTRRSVAEEIIGNAASACSRDPRFPPVKPAELPWLEISVDVLGEPENIASEDQLDVKRYGVIVSCGHRRGLLLPDLDGIDTPRQQVEIALKKGGIRKFERYKLQRFEVIRHY